jgi:hypothetical protein
VHCEGAKKNIRWGFGAQFRADLGLEEFNFLALYFHRTVGAPASRRLVFMRLYTPIFWSRRRHYGTRSAIARLALYDNKAKPGSDTTDPC